MQAASEDLQERVDSGDVVHTVVVDGICDCVSMNATQICLIGFLIDFHGSTQTVTATKKYGYTDVGIGPSPPDVGGHEEAPCQASILTGLDIFPLRITSFHCVSLLAAYLTTNGGHKRGQKCLLRFSGYFNSTHVVPLFGITIIK